MTRLASVCAAALLTAASVFAASRLTFQRTIPAPRSLGTVEDLVILSAIGDTDRVTTFVDVFLDQVNRDGTLRVIDPTMVERSTERHHRWRRPPKFVAQRYRADAYVRIEAFHCRTADRSGEGSEYDVDGNRRHATQRWTDATCFAHIDVLSSDRSRKLQEFSVSGEGTSPRGARITDEDREIAMDQAAHYAGVAAAEQIAPRHVRESIELVENAPAFDQGMAMVDGQEFSAARKLWESVLDKNRSSAALRFNLAAVCEAIGDLAAADRYYADAVKLAPKETRFRYEYDAFRRRYEGPALSRPRA